MFCVEYRCPDQAEVIAHTGEPTRYSSPPPVDVGDRLRDTEEKLQIICPS